MSDEEVVRSDEEGEKEETEAPAEEAPAEEAEAGQEEAAEAEEAPQPTEEETPKSPIKRADEGPSEAELAMQKRRQQPQSTSGLDEDALTLLDENRKERERMEEEIRELRERSEKRKREREEEERLLAERRAEEEARRKAEEEERRRKKQEEEERKKQERAKKMAEFEKWRNPTSPNFVITRKDRPAGSAGGEEEGVEGGEKKSKEQLEAEKRAILKQRIQPLEIDGFDTAKLAEKARELHAQVYRLESEKYDLERRFKSQLGDMLELAERARNMNKVGKHGSIRRVQLSDGESDKFQERFAGCPAKIVMYSQYERQKDKRPFKLRREVFSGPVFGFPPPKINPQKRVIWNQETGQPEYQELGGESGSAQAAGAEAEE